MKYLTLIGLLSLSPVYLWASTDELPCPEAVETRSGEFDHSARDQCVEKKKARIRDEKAALYATEYYIEKIDVRIDTKWVRTSPDTFRTWFYCGGWIEESMIPSQCKRRKKAALLTEAPATSPEEPVRTELVARPLRMHKAPPLSYGKKAITKRISFKAPKPAKKKDPKPRFDPRECGKNLARDEIDEIIKDLRNKAAKIPPQSIEKIAGDLLDVQLVQCAYDYTQVRFHNALAAKFRSVGKGSRPALVWQTPPIRDNAGKTAVFSGDMRKQVTYLESPIVFISQGAAGYPLETTVAVRLSNAERNAHVSEVENVYGGFERRYPHNRFPQASKDVFLQSNTLQLRMANPAASEKIRDLAKSSASLVTFTRIGNFVYYTTRGLSGEGEGYLYIPEKE